MNKSIERYTDVLALEYKSVLERRYHSSMIMAMIFDHVVAAMILLHPDASRRELAPFTGIDALSWTWLVQHTNRFRATNKMRRGAFQRILLIWQALKVGPGQNDGTFLGWILDLCLEIQHDKNKKREPWMAYLLSWDDSSNSEFLVQTHGRHMPHGWFPTFASVIEPRLRLYVQEGFQFVKSFRFGSHLLNILVPLSLQRHFRARGFTHVRSAATRDTRQLQAICQCTGLIRDLALLVWLYAEGPAVSAVSLFAKKGTTVISSRLGSLILAYGSERRRLDFALGKASVRLSSAVSVNNNNTYQLLYNGRTDKTKYVASIVGDQGERVQIETTLEFVSGDALESGLMMSCLSGTFRLSSDSLWTPQHAWLVGENQDMFLVSNHRLSRVVHNHPRPGEFSTELVCDLGIQEEAVYVFGQVGGDDFFLIAVGSSKEEKEESWMAMRIVRVALDRSHQQPPPLSPPPLVSHMLRAHSLLTLGYFRCHLSQI